MSLHLLKAFINTDQVVKVFNVERHRVRRNTLTEGKYRAQGRILVFYINQQRIERIIHFLYRKNNVYFSYCVHLNFPSNRPLNHNSLLKFKCDGIICTQLFCDAHRG